MINELLDKADRALASASLLLSAGDSDGASNRAYYGMFDAATAALLWTGAAQSPPKSHSGLISAFGLHLVQAGLLPPELGRAFNRVHELRLSGDYLADAVPVDKAREAIDAAAAFIAAVQHLLNQPKS
jgi:uncharacterized protein (UPF0332 family)